MGYIPKHSQAPLPHPFGCLCSSPGLAEGVQGSDLTPVVPQHPEQGGTGTEQGGIGT